MDYDYNELDSNWLELDCVIEVPWDDICCDLALYINKLNWKKSITKNPPFSTRGRFSLFLSSPCYASLTALSNLLFQLRHFLVFLSYLLLFIVSSVFSEQQGGLWRRVCLAPELSCYRGLNAMETKVLLHNALCVYVWLHTLVKYGQISVELYWLLFVPQTPLDSNTLWGQSSLEIIRQTWFMRFWQTLIRNLETD